MSTTLTTSRTTTPTVPTSSSFIPTATATTYSTLIMPTAKLHNHDSSTTASSIQCASLNTEGTGITSSSTFSNNSLTHNHNQNHNNIVNSLTHHNHQNNNINNNNTQHNQNAIPNGYTLHIKPSNNVNNNVNNNIATTNGNVNSNVNNNSNRNNINTPNYMNSNQAQPANVVSSTSVSYCTSSTSSSPTPGMAQTLISSESLSTFNLFDGLNNFPILGRNTTDANGNIQSTATTSGSPFTNALFNTAPPPTATITNPLITTNIVTDETVAQIVSNTSVPEFLYQLTKMLTDDHRSIIEWSNGKIEVHNPTKLEKEVLNQYFRHSKYASFQRQLNYFGFRKLAGKGKMAPCSYVNENATSDLRSLLRMKRKTSATTKDGKTTNDKNGSQDSPTIRSNASKTHGRPLGKKSTSCKRARKNGVQQHLLENVPSSSITIAKGAGVKHQLNGYLQGSGTSTGTMSTATTSGSSKYGMSNNRVISPSSSQITPINNPLVPDPMTSLDPLSIAKSAVGKGVTHQYHSSLPPQTTSAPSNTNTNTTSSTNNANNGVSISNSLINGIPTDSSNRFTFLDPSQLGMGIESCLSELQNNFRNSLNEANKSGNDINGNNGNDQSANSLQVLNSMQRESSLVNLAIIPSLSSILPPSTTQSTNNIASNNKSLESEYGMTFIDFPTGGIDPSTLPPPEN